MGHAGNAIVSPITASEITARGLDRHVKRDLLVFDYFVVLVVFASYFLPLFIPGNEKPI